MNRRTRHSFIVYEPDYRPSMRYMTVFSVNQAKKLAYKWGSGSEVWRFTREDARQDDPYYGSSSTHKFEFYVV